MSPFEMQFISVYVAALRRHYHELRTAIEVMNPRELAVDDFYTAAKIAAELRDLHENFEAQLLVLRRKHKFNLRSARPSPTEDELVDLFGLSFFKLMPPGAAITDGNATGWFSGKPQEWETSVKAYTAANKNEQSPANEFPAYFKFLAKLFLFDTPFVKKQPNSNKKLWPLAEDFNGYDDDMWDNSFDNPLDWLFGDTDDEEI